MNSYTIGSEEIHQLIDSYENQYPILWSFAEEIVEWFGADPNTPNVNIYGVMQSMLGHWFGFYSWIYNWDEDSYWNQGNPPPFGSQSQEDFLIWWNENMVGPSTIIEETPQSAITIEGQLYREYKYVEDRDLKISALRENLNYKNRTIKFSDINIQLTNLTIDDERLSDKLFRLSNNVILGKKIELYIRSQSAKKLSDCSKIGTLKITRYEHDDKQIKINANDISIESFYVDLPLAQNWVFYSEEGFENQNDKPIPILYGHVESAPATLYIEDYQEGNLSYFENNNLTLLPDNASLDQSDLQIGGIKDFYDFGQNETALIRSDSLQLGFSDTICDVPCLPFHTLSNEIKQFHNSRQYQIEGNKIRLNTEDNGISTLLATGGVWVSKIAEPISASGYQLHRGLPYSTAPQEILFALKEKPTELINLKENTYPYYVEPYLRFNNDFVEKINNYSEKFGTITDGPFTLFDDNGFALPNDLQNIHLIHTIDMLMEDSFGITGMTGGSVDNGVVSVHLIGFQVFGGSISLVQIPPTDEGQQEKNYPSDFNLVLREKITSVSAGVQVNPCETLRQYIFTAPPILGTEVDHYNPQVNTGSENWGNMILGHPEIVKQLVSNLTLNTPVVDSSWYMGADSGGFFFAGAEKWKQWQNTLEKSPYTIAFDIDSTGNAFFDEQTEKHISYRHSWMNAPTGTNSFSFQHNNQNQHNNPTVEASSLAVVTMHDAFNHSSGDRPFGSPGTGTSFGGEGCRGWANMISTDFMGIIGRRYWANQELWEKQFYVNAKGRLSDEYRQDQENIDNEEFLEGSHGTLNGIMKRMRGSIYCIHEEGTNALNSSISDDSSFFWLLSYLSFDKRYIVNGDDTYELLIKARHHSSGFLEYSHTYFRNIDLIGVYSGSPCINSNQQIDGKDCYELKIDSDYITYLSGNYNIHEYPIQTALSGDLTHLEIIYAKVEEDIETNTITNIEEVYRIDQFKEENDTEGSEIFGGKSKIVNDEDWYQGDSSRRLIQNPVEVVRNILINEMSYEGGFDEVSFNENYKLNDIYKMSFSINESKNSKKIIEDICSQSRLMARFRPRDAKVDFTSIKNTYTNDDVQKTIKTNNCLKYKFDKTPVEDLCIGGVYVKHRYNYETKNYDSRTDSKELPYDYGEENSIIEQYGSMYGINKSIFMDSSGNYPYLLDGFVLEFEANAIRDEASAVALRNYLFEQHKNQHLLIDFSLSLRDGLDLEIGDVISFDQDFQGVKPYGRSITEEYTLIDQIVYPYFIITSVRKTLQKVDVSVMQLHELYTAEDDTILGGGGDIESGDVNADNNLDVLDVILVVNHILGTSQLDDFEQIIADINNDNQIDVIDIVWMVGMILN